MFDSLPAASENAVTTIDLQAEMALPDRAGLVPVRYGDDDAIPEREQSARRIGLDLKGTTPTRLPDLLRAISKVAGQMAGDPFHAFDNNPFIIREWMIVSQVLHTAAASMENRFEALFLGL